jgi:hypothetical protein
MAATAPKGPLVVRWHGWDVGAARAGAAGLGAVALENAGTAVWRSEEGMGIQLASHWLDELGNPIVWDGPRAALPHPVAPGETVELELPIRAPIPPGRYRLAVDLVDEGRFWFAELGNELLEQDVDVAPRIERRLAVTGGEAPGQEEPLVAPHEAEAVAHLASGVVPAPDWSRRVLDAHQEGYAVVAGSIEADGRRLRRALAAWTPGSGRVPTHPGPLLCPSIVEGVEVEWLDPVEGLPAAALPRDEPWLYDGRITLRARPESGRRRG